MAETAMKLNKNEQHYADLVEAFLKDSKYQGIDAGETKKFLQLCIVNKLNPFKEEVYAVPRSNKQKDGTWKKTLTITISYKKFIETAEESGLLAGWTVLLNKKDGKVVSGKITIHRKDWTHPFEYSADVEDFINYRKDKEGNISLENSLWDTKREAMMRKQLIRIGFSLCFPKNIKSLDTEPEVSIEPVEVINEVPIYGPDGDRIEEEPVVVENDVIAPVSHDQEDMIDRLCVLLVDFQPEPNKPANYDEAEILIRSMQFTVGKLYIKDKKLQNLTRENIDLIFTGDDSDIVNVKKAAIKHLESITK